jgi:hypothetical protein
MVWYSPARDEGASKELAEDCFAGTQRDFNLVRDWGEEISRRSHKMVLGNRARRPFAEAW